LQPHITLGTSPAAAAFFLTASALVLSSSRNSPSPQATTTPHQPPCPTSPEGRCSRWAPPRTSDASAILTAAQVFNQEFIVDERYNVTKELGQGAYGIVW
jgi:hypothetical protein